MKKWFTFPIAAFLLALTGSVNAAVVYDNGAPNQVGGLTVVGDNDTNPIGAIFDDFTLATKSVIDSIQFWTIENQSSGFWNGQINLFITGDNAGQPNLGDIKAAGLASLVSKTATGNVVATGGGPADEYVYTANLPTSFVAEAGVQYWVGLYLGLSSNQIFWEYTNANGSDPAQAFIPETGTWISTPVHLAYNLQGSPIPGPAPLALIGLGIAGLMLRRKA